MLSHFAIFDIDTPELIIILVILLLLFGGKKLPQLARSIGESLQELRKGVSGDIKDTSTKAKGTGTKKADRDS
jgi:sec-independent protein translocase protein TatA